MKLELRQMFFRRHGEQKALGQGLTQGPVD